MQKKLGLSFSRRDAQNAEVFVRVGVQRHLAYDRDRFKNDKLTCNTGNKMSIPAFEDYSRQSEKIKKEQCKQLLCEYFSDQYKLVSVSKKHGTLPTVYDQNRCIYFKMVFPATVSIGLSQPEEEAIDRIAKERNAFPPNIEANWSQPVFRANVDLMLVSSVPVLSRDYLRLSGGKIDVEHGLDSPLYISFEKADEFCRSLGGRILSETEWEHICRAGTKTVFFWGDHLLSEKELEKYLYLQDFFPGKNGEYHGMTRIPEKQPKPLHLLESKPLPLGHNPFGFYALFVGEWCRDYFSYGYNEPRADGEHVVRGGGSLFWPWQDEEWIYCVSAVRTPESDTMDRRAAFRLVVDAKR